MYTTNLDEIHDQLRAWARGMYPLEAATELLIRTGFAQPGHPWVLWDSGRERYWVDFDHLLEAADVVSGGERRVLAIAASLGGTATAVQLDDVVSGLDRRHLDLVLAAIAHAGGSHQHSRMGKRNIATPDGGEVEIDFPVIGGGYEASLHDWPASS